MRKLRCARCPRLVALRRRLKRQYPDYHNAPVPAAGPRDAGLLIVGLAPGLHGANRSGRPFEGDSSGDLLFAALNDAAARLRNDGLQPPRWRITNAVKCLPPENRPRAAEIANCRPHLVREIGELPAPGAILALGRVAHEAVLSAMKLNGSKYPFAHGARYDPAPGIGLFASYHCSRYNQNTGRIDKKALTAVIEAAMRYQP